MVAMRDVKDETTETELNTFDALDYPIRLSRLRGKFMASHEICTDSRFATPGGLLQYIDRTVCILYVYLCGGSAASSPGGPGHAITERHLDAHQAQRSEYCWSVGSIYLTSGLPLSAIFTLLESPKGLEEPSTCGLLRKIDACSAAMS